MVTLYKIFGEITIVGNFELPIIEVRRIELSKFVVYIQNIQFKITKIYFRYPTRVRLNLKVARYFIKKDVQ